MAFAAGSVTFKRFFVDGRSPKLGEEALVARLAERATGSDSLRTADYTEVGWTTGDHLLDTSFDLHKNAVAGGLHFALRIDANRPPAEIVRSYQRINEQAMLEASGRDFLSRAERREAREQALARADAEARSGTFRKSKAVPVFWDLRRNELYLGATGVATADYLALLFRETFGLSAVAASSGELAARWSAATGATREFDDCRPAFFIPPPEGLDNQGQVSGVNEGRSRDFLGTEWLTWLWYTSHVESPEVTTGARRSIATVFERALQLDCPFRITGSVAIRADDPTGLPEAAAALAGGKQPVRAGLQIAAPGGVFCFTVRGDAMHFSGVRLPPPEDAAGAKAVLEDRIGKLRDLIDAVSDIYAAFLKRRLSKKWPTTLGAMRQWASGAGHAGMSSAAGADVSASLGAAS